MIAWPQCRTKKGAPARAKCLKARESAEEEQKAHMREKCKEGETKSGIGRALQNGRHSAKRRRLVMGGSARQYQFQNPFLSCSFCYRKFKRLQLHRPRQIESKMPSPVIQHGLIKNLYKASNTWLRCNKGRGLDFIFFMRLSNDNETHRKRTTHEDTEGRVCNYPLLSVKQGLMWLGKITE